MAGPLYCMSFAAWRINKGRLEAQILLYAFMRHIFAGVSLFEQAQICSQPSSLHQRASKASKARAKIDFLCLALSCHVRETRLNLKLEFWNPNKYRVESGSCKTAKIDAKQFESEFKQKSQI